MAKLTCDKLLSIYLFFIHDLMQVHANFSFQILGSGTLGNGDSVRSAYIWDEINIMIVYGLNLTNVF